MCGLKSSHIVKYSRNLIKPTQASQWVNFMHNEIGLSKASMVMMWNMCEMLEMEKSLRGNNDDCKFMPKSLVNSFRVDDKINVMPNCYVRKSNGIYFNIGGDIYLNADFDDICVIERESKEISVRIGFGSFGKLETIL